MGDGQVASHGHRLSKAHEAWVANKGCQQDLGLGSHPLQDQDRVRRYPLVPAPGFYSTVDRSAAGGLLTVNELIKLWP